MQDFCGDMSKRVEELSTDHSYGTDEWLSEEQNALNLRLQDALFPSMGLVGSLSFVTKR